MKKHLCVLLSLLLLLSGCGNGKADAGNRERASAVPDVVYRAERLSLENGCPVSTIDAFCISGDRLFAAATCVTGTKPYVNLATGEPVIDQETGEPVEVDVQETLLFRIDLDTRETVCLEPYEPLAAPEGQEGVSFLLDMAAGADGTVWTLESVFPYFYNLPEDFDVQTGDVRDYYVQGEPLTALNQYDGNGVKLQSVALAVSYPQQMLLDQNGNVVIRTGDGISLFDSQGTLLAELENPGGAELFQLSGTETGVLENDAMTGGTALRLIDPAAGGFGEKAALVSGVRQVYPGFGEYQYLYQDFGDAVYAYAPENGGQVKLFSWTEAGMGGKTVLDLTALEDGRLFALSWDQEQEVYELFCLVQVDGSALPPVRELTLAGMNIGADLRRQVSLFNSGHEDVRIVIKDYAEEYDFTMSKIKLNTELLSGVVPDMLCIGIETPVAQYASMGMLTDLWPLIDGDESLSRDDLMTHFFDVLSTDGKLYQVAGKFWIYSAAGDASVIGDRTGWTFAGLREVRETRGPDAAVFGGYLDSKGQMLLTCAARCFNSFMDWEAKTCSFDSEEFIDILNFANSFPEEAEWETETSTIEIIENTRSRFDSGEQLLVEATFSDFFDIKKYNAMVGENVCYVGYPSSDESGNVFAFADGLAITTACRDVDLAWSFVRTLLTEDGTEPEYMSAGFPANRHVFEAYAEKKMSPNYQTDFVTGEKVERPAFCVGLGAELVEIWPVTQEEYDTVMRLYESCDSIYNVNDTVWEIVAEEAAPFFDGQKTAMEAAKLIQDRVSLYMMEQG